MNFPERYNWMNLLREGLGMKPLPPEPPFRRGADILDALTRPMSLGEISRAIDKRTDQACRDLAKLLHMGLVERSPTKGAWQPAGWREAGGE